MQAFPYLLQRLDALQDQFAAAAESNEILKSALEQMQDPATSNSVVRGGEATTAAVAPIISVATALRLARENYLLSAPYQIDLLMGYTGAAAFSDFPTPSSSVAVPRVKTFPPFRVASVTKRTQAPGDERSDKDGHASVTLTIVADASDPNGASYLNRSKINAFLEFAQGKAAKSKFKEIIFARLAELITRLREVKTQFGAETTALRATIQMLQREVEELKHRLKTTTISATTATESSNTTTLTASAAAADSQVSLTRRNLLMKLIDLFVEKQQEQRQSTFLTQSAPSDVLLSSALTLVPSERDVLDLSNCAIDDADLSDVLVKIQVSGASFHAIYLDASLLSDTGAQHLATFVAKCPPSVNIIRVEGRSQMTYHGVEALKRGLLQNASVHRVDVDSSGQVIDAVAAQDEFEIHGRPSVVLRVFLPELSHRDAPVHARRASDGEIDSMVERMHEMGFSDLFERKMGRASAPAFALYSAPMRVTPKTKTRSSSDKSAMLMGVDPTSTASRRQAVRRAQEHKFQRLEAAIKRATTSSASSGRRLHSSTRVSATSYPRPRSAGTTRPVSAARSGGVSVSLTQSFSSSLLTRAALSASSTYSSSRAIYGGSGSAAHLATVRGLKQ